MCIYLPGDVSDLNSACYKTAPVIKSTTVEHKDGRPHSGQAQFPLKVQPLCVLHTNVIYVSCTSMSLFRKEFEKAFSGIPIWRFNVLKSWLLSGCRMSALSTGLFVVLWWLFGRLCCVFIAWPSQSNFFIFPRRQLLVCGCRCNIQYAA